MGTVLNKEKEDFELTILFSKLGELIYRKIKQGKMVGDDFTLKQIKNIDKFIENNVE